MAARNLPKVEARVRFPSPAPDSNARLVEAGIRRLRPPTPSPIPSPVRWPRYGDRVTSIEWPAGRLLGKSAVRGTLSLSETHVRFTPQGIAARVQGTPFAVQLKHIAAAGVVPGTPGKLLRRGTPDRLCLTLGDGSEQLFEVSEPDGAAAAIRARLAGR
jgi:hypothetical protein